MLKNSFAQSGNFIVSEPYRIKNGGNRSKIESKCLYRESATLQWIISLILWKALKVKRKIICTYTQSLFSKVPQLLTDYLLNRFFFLKLLVTFIQQNLTKSYIFFHTVFFNNNFFLHRRSKWKRDTISLTLLTMQYRRTCTIGVHGFIWSFDNFWNRH